MKKRGNDVGITAARAPALPSFFVVRVSSKSLLARREAIWRVRLPSVRTVSRPDDHPLLVPLQLRPQLAGEVIVRVGVVPVLLPLLDILGVLFLGAPLCRSETFAGPGQKGGER